MRLLLVHRYFWPDTPPYASMLRYLGADWHAQGHEVYVFTAQPSYKSDLSNKKQPAKESVDGIQVVRCKLFSAKGSIATALNTILFVIQLMWFILSKNKFDVIVMSTVPQVIGAWCASLVAVIKKSRFVYHMQDIHPEGAVFAGIVKSSIVERVLKFLDTQTCARSASIVVLSNDMKSTLLSRNHRLDTKVHVIKNPPMSDYSRSVESELMDASLEAKARTSSQEQQECFKVVFAGNIGRFQGLETVIEAGILLRDSSRIRIIFVGDGKARATLESKAKLAGSVIEFTGHKSVSEADQLISEADLALITLAPNIYKVAFPSKILSYSKLGVPIVAVIEPQSELASMIREWDMGFAVDVGDAHSLAKGLKAASEAPEKIATQATNVRNFGLTTFCVDRVKSQWYGLLEGRA